MLTFNYFLLSLGGVLSILQMDKDLQYNCYYQILKEHSTKSRYVDNDYIDYNHRSDDSLQLSIKDSKSIEALLRVRRSSIDDDSEEVDNISYQHRRNTLIEKFTTAYAEPRNSGRFRYGGSDVARSKTLTTRNVTAFDYLDYLANNLTQPEVAYFIVASKTLRPGFVYKVSVSVLQAQHPIKVFANISCDGVNLSSDTKDVVEGATETLQLRIPPTALRKQSCRLRMEGFYLNVFCDAAFLHEQALDYMQHARMIFIQTDKPLYMQGDAVRFRITVTNADFKPSDCIVEVLITDPNQHIARRWLTQLPPAGTLALDYRLSKEPSFGEWTINVAVAEIGGQQEQLHFVVEEFYRPRTEVKVMMPAVSFSTTAFIKGSVAAISTFGIDEDIERNLTVTATIYPMGHLNATALNRDFRLGFHLGTDENGESKGAYTVKQPLLNGTSLSDINVSNFNGSYSFKWPKEELEKFQGSFNFTALEILVIARVTMGHELNYGYAISRIYTPAIRVVFLGGSPQVFKPSLPFTVLIAAEHVDGSPIDSSLLQPPCHLEVSGSIQSQGSVLSWPARSLSVLRHNFGIWELKIDLRNDLEHLRREVINEITEMRLQVHFFANNQSDASSKTATTSAELLLISHYSPRQQFIKVTTSTDLATIGEYMIFEVSSNFFVEEFNFMILSKGVIVFSERESLAEGMRTLAVVISAEMAPVAEMVVWAVTWQGQIVTDSLIFPVSGMFIDNFTLSVQSSYKNVDMNKQFYEVSISGEPESYVSLSGLAQDVFKMQTDAAIMSYSTVTSKMSAADRNINKLRKHIWNPHRDLIGEANVAFYETSTSGIDANDSFIESGLIVFTDGVVPRRAMLCNQLTASDQKSSCLLMAKRSDKILNPIQLECNKAQQLHDFRRFRINRIFEHYENVVWFWKDVQIGIGGQLKFYASAPPSDEHQWIISGYSTSPMKGVGILRKNLIVAEVKKAPFIADVALPGNCRRYEHVSIRVRILNNNQHPLVATISLKSSADYTQITYEREKSTIQLTLEAQERKSIDMHFRPTSLGSTTVVVKVKSAYGLVELKRNLSVESADEWHRHRRKRIRHFILPLNLSAQQENLVEYLNVSQSTSALKTQTRISVVGNAFAAQFVSLTKQRFPDAASEIAGEFVFAGHLYSLMYLRLTKKYNAASEKQIYYEMNRSYQHLLAFMHSDGYFSHFRNVDGSYSAPSVWLTAYCLRLFQEASHYKMIDYIWIDVASIIEKSLNWLLQQQQQATGVWLQPDASVDVFENDLTLTAQALITLAVMRDLNDSFAVRIDEAAHKAITWIGRNLHRLQNDDECYDLAVTTYALLLHKSSLAERTFPLLDSLARRKADYYIYWSSFKLKESRAAVEPQYDSVSIEATAYALLCYLMQRNSDVELIVNWLNLNALHDDEATMSARAMNAAMRALIEFSARSRRRDSTAITVKLSSPKVQPRINHTFHINSSNAEQLQSIELFDVWGSLKVSANGVGYAILQVDREEDVDVDNDAQQLQSPAFRIRKKVACRDEDCSYISYTCCINWLNKEQTGRSGMSILDVAIPTGYTIQQQQLNSYVLNKSVKHLIQAKFMETRILFYFLNLVEEDVCVDFVVKRLYFVANLSCFLPVHVYEYSSPEHFAATTQNALAPQKLLKNCAVGDSSSCANCLLSKSAAEAKITWELHVLLLVIQVTSFIYL